MSLFRAPTSSIGVDLGTSYTKVIQLAKDKRGISLVTYAVAPTANSLLAGTGTDAVGQAAVMLREMFKRAGVGRAPVAAALPILSVFSTVLELPEMPVRDMDAAVTFAARHYVPSPLSDVVLGWMPIGPPMETRSSLVRENPPDVSAQLERTDLKALSGLPGGAAGGPARNAPANIGEVGAGAGELPETLAVVSKVQDVGPPPGASTWKTWLRKLGGQSLQSPHPLKRRTQEIFLTAAPRDLVVRYATLFDSLGVGLSALEVESFPLARSLLTGEERPVLLVDLGDRTTSFAIVDGGYLRLNQAMDVGGTSLTAAIAEKLSLSLEDAEQRKWTEGMSRGDVATPLAAAMRLVLTEIVQRGEVLRRLYERKKARTLGRVILIGGGARLPGLTSFWTGVTGLPAEVGNPWRGISVPKVLAERLRVLGPSFAVAVGLALRPFENA